MERSKGTATRGLLLILGLAQVADASASTGDSPVARGKSVEEWIPFLSESVGPRVQALT